MHRLFKRLPWLVFGGGLVSCAPTPPAEPPPIRRVVLVHGIFEDGKDFSAMRRQLERRGVECLVPSLRPADGREGLDQLALQLKHEIDRGFGPDERFAVVGFSMGGLVSRHYLQELGGAERCEAFLTISSPHHGSGLAWLYPGKGAAQMRPGSEFLRQLEEGEERLGSIPIVSYRTPLDLMILPASSSIWDRAENIGYAVPLHPWMLSSPRVIRDVTRRLTEPAPEARAEGETSAMPAA